MIDPLFEYFNTERTLLSQHIYREPREPKTYARFKKFSLPLHKSLEMSLSKTILKRKSTRTFGSNPLSPEEISTLLFWSVGSLTKHEKGSLSKYPHPSGGKRCALECYLFILKDTGNIPRGAYHYNKALHALEQIPHTQDMDAYLKKTFADSDSFIHNSTVVFVLSFVKSRLFPKYGTLSYKLALTEAGHVGQNIYLISAALSAQCCALGTANVEPLHALLKLDGYNEIVCHAVAAGK